MLYCKECGQAPDPSVGLDIEIHADGYCDLCVDAIRERLEDSSLKGLIPDDFEIVGDGAEIIFIPQKPFWERWRVWRNWMEAVGCRVYGYPSFRPARRGVLEDWRCQLSLSMLDSGISATLVRLGFWNVKKETIEETIDELDRQVDNLRNRQRDDALHTELDDFSDHQLQKENYERYLDKWILETAEALHAE